MNSRHARAIVAARYDRIFSHFDGARNVELVREARFVVLSDDDEQAFKFGVPVRFR